MAKFFITEIREIFNKKYLKVTLKDNNQIDSISNLLSGLNSVKRVNITKQENGSKNLTIYPNKVYAIEEVKDEVELSLGNFFNGSPVDPEFVSETISSISEKAYFQIIDYILILGKNLESFKALNVKFDEERYRDYFIPFLNSISKNHSAKGEVFNRKGKTDILLFDQKGNNIFIAECKIWKGQALLLDAINQLLDLYVNWRDEKTALIIFNKDMKNFSDLIDTATKAIAAHPLCLKYLGCRSETSYSYIFKNSTDKSKNIRLELVLLNFA